MAESEILQQGPVAMLPSRFGMFNITIFRDRNLLDHAVIFLGDLKSDEPVLCRIHSECLTGDTLGSLRCDCGFQLEAALGKIAKAGRGALLYMRQEGRGIGLFNKIAAYRLQDQGLDTVEANLKLGLPADGRTYGLCAEIMRAMGFEKVILMTNNPAKINDIAQHGIEVVAREPLEYGENTFNEEYLRTKEKKMGHLLHHQDQETEHLSFEFNGRLIATDDEGYLLNKEDWSEQLRDFMAQKEGLILTADHIAVINTVREYYFEFETTPPMRGLIKLLRAKGFEHLTSSAVLAGLFPEGAAKTAARLSGLPKPVKCI